MYKEFIEEKEFDGTLFDLIKEIVEAFVNEGVGPSKLGEFYNIAGVIKMKKYGDITFNSGVDDIWMDVKLDISKDLDEEIIKESVLRELYYGIMSKNRELDVDGQFEEIRLDTNIKATYTLACS